MENRLRKAVLVAAMFLPALSGEAAEERQGQEQRGIEGVWDVSVTIVSCTTGAPLITDPHGNITSFIDGGALTAVIGRASDPFSGSASRSASLGMWRHVGGSNYTSREKYFEYTAAGTFNDTVIVTRDIELGKNGDEYANTAISEFYDASDQLFNTVCATATATRFE